jgi:hypothetical protein
MPGTSGGSTTTVQKTEPWQEQKPYLIDVFKQAQALNNQPGPYYYPGATVAPFSPETDLALNAQSARGLSGSPITAAGGQHLYNTLAGQYLPGNPYLGGAMDAASQGVVRNYQYAVQPGLDSSFAGAGRYGSGLHLAAQQNAQQVLAEQLANITSGMAYQGYGDERRNMLQAASLAPNLAAQDYLDIGQLASAGAARERQYQNLTDAEIARFNFGQQLPYNKLAQYQNLIQGNYGGTATTTESGASLSGTDVITGLLGGLRLMSTFSGY